MHLMKVHSIEKLCQPNSYRILKSYEWTYYKSELYINPLREMLVDCHVIEDCDHSDEDVESQISVKIAEMMELYTKKIESEEEEPNCKKRRTE